MKKNYLILLTAIILLGCEPKTSTVNNNNTDTGSVKNLLDTIENKIGRNWDTVKEKINQGVDTSKVKISRSLDSLKKNLDNDFLSKDSSK